MASHSMSTCCISGVKHEGESTGEYKEIDGYKYYIAYPKDKKNGHGILFLCDAFGLELVNNRLLADAMATSGYTVLMPDLFSGDAVPVNAFDTPGKFDIASWAPKHGIEQTEPIVDAALKVFRGELGIKKIGAAGYCFGGKYVMRYLKEGRGVDAGFVAHPSMVQDGELESISKPLSIAAAENDHQMTLEKRRYTEDWLAKSGLPYEIYLYGGAHHGFAVRSDLSVRKNRANKESAYVQALRWFDVWLNAAA